MRTTTVETDRTEAVVDVTEAVAALVPDGHAGACLVDVPHTTAGVVVNEPEAGLLDDLGDVLRTVVPEASYAHDRIDDNAAAHLRSSLIGDVVVLPVEGGALALGTWQAVLLVECDGPRRRTLRVQPLAGAEA
ncbi:MAG: secondary thiamine-phosphate synthase enzyme YjbQ [Halobacteriales archaeon]